MKRTIRLTIAGVATGGLAIAVTGPALASTAEANLRPDDMRGLQVVDDQDDDPRDDRDPRGRDMTWTDNTGPSLTGTVSRSGLTGPGNTDATRDWTRSVDFTRDLTRTNTNTNTMTNTQTNTHTQTNTNTRGR